MSIDFEVAGDAQNLPLRRVGRGEINRYADGENKQ
jgi:hypothetical protein